MIWCSPKDPSQSITKGSIPAKPMCNPEKIQGAQRGCREKGKTQHPLQKQLPRHSRVPNC